jgi:hypothetical protein
MTASSAPGIDAADEVQLLEAIDRGIDRGLKPIVKEYDHAGSLPGPRGRANEGARPVGEGTNEIQRVIIAKQWLARHPVS